MPSYFRIFEIVLYTIVNYLPYFFLALYPFKNDFRFSRGVNICLFTSLTVIEIIVCVWASLFASDNSVTSFLNTVIYALFFFFAIKAHPGKLLFILLVVSNMANQVVFSAKCLEGVFFPALAVQDQRWSFSVTSIMAELLFLPPFFLFLKKQFTEAVAVQIQEKIWNYLWLIPGTFYLLWFYLAYFNSLSGVTLALQPIYTVFAILINSGALLVYYVVTRAVREFARNLDLRTQNNQLAIQNLQYKNLKERMDETRRARHDLRQHMTVLYSLCSNKEYGQMESYLREYLDSAPTGDYSVSYCSHNALNALLVYYAQIARESNISFSASLSVPEEISMNDMDLCVLFGNLLENSCYGCMLLPEDKRQIRLKVLMPSQSSLVLTLDNTCSPESVRKVNEQYFSSRHEGYGIGLESVHNIIARYNGVLKTEIKDGVFLVSAVLNL